jgi:signal transduction histidine kinase
MESVGQLAGGIAHDFNNILMSIHGCAELIALKVTDPALLRFLDNILSSADRAAAMVQNLLAFARKQMLRPTHCDMNRFLEGVRPRIEEEIGGANIALRYVLTDAPLPVFIDSAQIEQALIRLVANAKDAMPVGGSLGVSTDSVVIGEDFHGHCRPEAGPGAYVVVTVSDTGCGMDKNTLQNVFDPFFTTKEFGTGAGLGCAIVQGIIAQHHGFVDVESEPGRGAAFRLYLPRDAAFSL